MRIKIVNLIIMFLFLFVALGIINLSVLQRHKFKDLSNKNCIRFIPQAGARGKIFDRQGQIIVDNYLTYDVMILPQDKSQVDKSLSIVSNVLQVSFKDLKDKFNAGYVAPFLPVVVKNNVDLKKAIALEELRFDFPAIIIQPHPLRRYVYGSLACHVIGYLSGIDYWRLSKLSDYGYGVKDIVGYGGVEEKYDYFLRQEEGTLSVVVDHRGKMVRILGFKPPHNGKDVTLTIDLGIQKIVENNLSDKKGSIILMDPYSGEIIAMASSPNFNPAIFTNISGAYATKLFTDSDAPLLNRAISGIFPPGSVFKPVVASGALETGKINLNTTFFCSGGVLIGKRHFGCWNTHNQENVIDAIEHSCNVFFYKTGIILGPQAIHDYAVKFGFSKPTLIDLPYEASGFVPSPLWKKVSRLQGWFDGDTANFSIGQGDLLVTPIQITRMIAVFANGGFLVSPYIVKNIGGYDVTSYHKKSVKIPVKEFALNYVRQGLRKVVADPNGTASILSSIGVSMSGKTGTVQVPHGQPHAWFVGYFPYDKPRFVICVFIEHGGAGYVSTVLTKQIIEEMIQEGMI
ncbi:MAG: penicillin-binding protein 2 [Candidatus Omnitrophota bacterium]